MNIRTPHPKDAVTLDVLDQDLKHFLEAAEPLLFTFFGSHGYSRLIVSNKFIPNDIDDRLLLVTVNRPQDGQTVAEYRFLKDGTCLCTIRTPGEQQEQPRTESWSGAVRELRERLHALIMEPVHAIDGLRRLGVKLLSRSTDFDA